MPASSRAHSAAAAGSQSCNNVAKLCRGCASAGRRRPLHTAAGRAARWSPSRQTAGHLEAQCRQLRSRRCRIPPDLPRRTVGNCSCPWLAAASDACIAMPGRALHTARPSECLAFNAFRLAAAAAEAQTSVARVDELQHSSSTWPAEPRTCPALFAAARLRCHGPGSRASTCWVPARPSAAAGASRAW